MSIFSRRSRSGTSRADAAELEQQVATLRRALASCRTTARRSKGALALAFAVVVVSFGFLLRDRIDAYDLGREGLSILGIGQSAQGVDAAYAAFKEGDEEQALRLSRPFAEQGNARAQSLMGLIFQTGRGIPQDEREAAKWFRLAANQGDHVAQYYLGLMYDTGRGVPQNFAEAAKWYELAADSGNPQAQFNLGAMYYNGQGVPQSSIVAHKWFNLAATNFPASDTRNREAAVRVRDVLAMKMSREEIAQAQRLARDWQVRRTDVQARQQ